MTTLDLSHLPWLSRTSAPSTGQAVATSAPLQSSTARKRRASFDTLDSDTSSYAGRRDVQRKSERARGRVPMPAVPDLRFEPGYLLSIMPFLRPIGEASIDEGDETAGPSASLFHRPLSVHWRPLLWVTFRDQVVSPLLQGLMWGTIGFGATAFMLWRKLQPRSSRAAALLHANLVAWAAALLGAESHALTKEAMDG